MPEPTNPNMITHVPTAAELEQGQAQIQDIDSSATYTREALQAMGEGATGTAAELNAAYPSTAEVQPVSLPPKETAPAAEPFIDDSSVRMDDIRKVIADLHNRGQTK